MPNLKELVLGQTGVTKKAIPLISDRLTLQTLDISGLKLEDNDIIPVANISSLQKLYAGFNKLTNKSLPSLGSIKSLRVLDLHSNPGITDAGMLFVRELTELQELSLDQAGISARGLLNLKALPNLKRLNFGKVSLSGGDYEALLNLSRLESLELSRLTLNATTLERLARFKNLQSLRLTGCRGDKGFFRRKLSDRLPGVMIEID